MWGTNQVSPPRATASYQDSSIKTVVNLRGRGHKVTPKFNVSNTWELWWHYACSGTGGFSLVIYKGHNAVVGKPVSKRGQQGRHTSLYHQAGTYYIQVDSACGWQVKVIDLAAPVP